MILWNSDKKPRCPWAGSDPIYVCYHDTEWGTPLHNDQKLFEFLLLEGAQAGLSWYTILKKRENFRAALDNFDPQKMVKYNQKKIEHLLLNKGIIRNRLKIMAFIENANAFLGVQKEFGSFSAYLWSFVSGEPIKNMWRDIEQIPSETKESIQLSKDLKQRGFKFVGPKICYAYMQAVGIVNDHLISCFRYHEV